MLWLVLPQVLFLLLGSVSSGAAVGGGRKTLTLHPSLVQDQRRNYGQVVLPEDAPHSPHSLREGAARDRGQRRKRQAADRPQGLRENVNLLPANSTTVVSLRCRTLPARSSCT